MDKCTRAGLPGAVFELKAPDGGALTGISDSMGLTQFTIMPGINYTLTEIAPPAGYEPIGAPFHVSVDGGGHLYVNGQCRKYFAVFNEHKIDFEFFKVLAGTVTGLAGANYELLACGAVIGTAVSDATGLVHFGAVAPGTYQLRETIPPAGYLCDPTVYTVVVCGDGAITINCMPLRNFVAANVVMPISEMPAIHPVTAGNTLVTGMGMPMCAITVLFADGAQAATTVLPDGTWAATVPAGTMLVSGEQVSAMQTCPCSLPSDPASVVIAPLLLSVTYYANGGVGSYMDTNIPQHASYTIKTAVETGISRPNHTLVSWNTVSDGSGTTYTPNSQVTLNNNLFLYAQWQLTPSNF